MQIYGKVKIHFGNLWAFTSMLILRSKKNGSIYVSSRMRRRNLVLQMLEHFDTTGSDIIWVDEPYSSRQRKFGVRNHKHPFAKTKVQWEKGPYNRICYQLTTKSNNRRFKSKKISQEETDKILDYLSRKFELIEVGLPFTMGESIHIMANSDAFFGICSGMSQVAHSVGIPTFLYDWKFLRKCHRGKVYKKFKTLDCIKQYVESGVMYE